MPTRSILVAWLLIAPCVWAQRPPDPNARSTEDLGDLTDFTELVSDGKADASWAKVVGAKRADQKGLAVLFKGTPGLHYYADPTSSPSPDLALQVRVHPNTGPLFGGPVFPVPATAKDPSSGKEIQVYAGVFTVFIPAVPGSDQAGDVNVVVSGLTCTETACLPPFEASFKVRWDPLLTQWSSVQIAQQDLSTSEVAYRDLAVYAGLALVAGLSINVMPCVLPVLPLIILRLVRQTKAGGAGRGTQTLAFCVGIVCFFAAFALIAAAVRAYTGRSLDLNDLFRSANAMIILFLVMVGLSVIMFDALPIVLPSSLTGPSGSGSGMAGSFGMGFFAAVLSTPCSGALLGGVLAWAQTQPAVIGMATLCVMGVGMALPYAVLAAFPSLLDRLPKPGPWMEIFKKSCGFLLLLIGVKLALVALPKERMVHVLMYAVILGFCLWMWGSWVPATARPGTRWGVRACALLIASYAGVGLLPQTKDSMVWQTYDSGIVTQSLSEGRPVLIKFTADWCTNCKVVERTVYGDRSVTDRIKATHTLALKADTTTRQSPATLDLRKVYGEPGTVPLTILLIPGRQPSKLRGVFDKTELLALLEILPDQEKP